MILCDSMIYSALNFVSGGECGDMNWGGFYLLLLLINTAINISIYYLGMQYFLEE